MVVPHGAAILRGAALPNWTERSLGRPALTRRGAKGTGAGVAK